MSLATNCATADSAYKNGHYAEAVREYKKATDNEQNDANKSLLYLGLGLAQNKLSKYSESERSLQSARELAEKAHAKDSVAMAIVLNAYASNLKSPDKFQESEQLHDAAIQIAKEKLTPDDLLLAQFINDKGTLLMDDGKFSEAEPLLNKALGIREKAGTAGTSGYAESLMNTGVLSLRQNNATRAVVLLKRSVLTYESLNKDHPQTGIAQHHYGTALLRGGRFLDAIKQFRSALKLMEKELPEDHPIRIEAINALASAELRIHEVSAARSDFEDALKLSDRDPSRNRSNILASSVGLGMCLSSQHDYKAAEPHFQRARALISEAEKHNERTTVEGLITCYLFQGKFLEALHLMPDRWKMSNESTLSEYVGILNLLTGLGDKLGWKKDDHEAR